MKRRLGLPVFLVVTAGVWVQAPQPVRAQVPGYKIETIAKLGDTIGDLKLSTTGGFGIDRLSDDGQLCFTSLNAAGGGILFHYSDGKFTPIVVGGGAAPGGTWPRSVVLWGEAMNQQGDMIFMAGTSSNSLTTYRWNRLSGQASIVAAAAMPAANDLTFVAGGDGTTPAINDHGDVVFQARVRDAAGKTQRAIFFLGRDGKLTPVLTAGQAVAGAGTVEPAPDGGTFTLNNAGVLGFQARRQGVDTSRSNSIFRWENGTITPVLFPGADAPGGGKLAAVGGGHVNNKNRNVMVGGNLDGKSYHVNFYMVTGDHMVPIAVIGQEMPGGGKYTGYVTVGIHSFNGDNAFIAELEGGDTAAYRYDADGKLSLIVKGSALGANLALRGSNYYGVGINSKGEVALPVQFKGEKVSTLVLLKPITQ